MATVIYGVDDDDGSESEYTTDPFCVEYELESPSTENTLTTDTDVEKDTRECTRLKAIFYSDDNSDLPFWADLSDSSDSDIGDADKWQCSKCKCLNTPLRGYCEKCCSVRENWLREGPRKKSKLNKKQRRKLNIQTNNPPTVGASQEKGTCALCGGPNAVAAIVHGRTAHRSCCYTCARELEVHHKPCPFCHRRIDKVVHII